MTRHYRNLDDPRYPGLETDQACINMRDLLPLRRRQSRILDCSDENQGFDEQNRTWCLVTGHDPRGVMFGVGKLLAALS